MVSTQGTIILLVTFLKGALCEGANSSECVPASVGGYASPSGCILQQIKSSPLRVVYLDKQYATQNLAANAKVGNSYIFGRTCENIQTAVPECFVAENWKGGWLGQFMWGVFSNYMQLESSDIAAMTTLNFTGATDPKNATSVYKGSSSFTRCVWEINLGNVDICVGDFWETQERRGIAAFTTAIAVDKFILVTSSVTNNAPPMLVFPSAFNPASLATIFLPLTWQVWLLHIAMMVFGAAAILFMEATGAYLRHGGGGDADSDSGGGGSEEGDGGGRLSINGLLKSVYAALIHFLWNGPKHDTRTAGGKLALFGLCFHTLIIAASYTASLAGFLSTPSSVPIVVLSFDSIQNSPLSSLAGRLCVLQSAQGLFSALDREKLVGMDNYGPMYEQLYRGKCGSLVTGANEYLMFAQGGRTAFSVCADESDPLGYATCQNGGPSKVINLYQCTCPGNPRADPTSCPEDCPYIDRYKDIVPSDQDGFDAWYNWALPVRQEYAEVISNAILSSRLNNDLDVARRDQLLSNVTAKYNALGAPSTLSSIITVESIVSVYIYTAALIGLALVIHFIQIGSANRSCGDPLVAVTAADGGLALENTNYVIKDSDHMKMAAAIPAPLPSMEEHLCSPEPSKVQFSSENGAAVKHLELLCQRLAQLGKELDIRISSAGDINSPSNAVCSAIGSDGKVRGNDILTTALTASGQASLQVPVQEVRAVPPNLESGPRHSIGNGEPAALSDDGVVLDMPSGKEEVPKGQLDEFMTPLQNLISTVLCFVNDGTRSSSLASDGRKHQA